MSHELRTPLNSIIAFNTLLMESPLSHEHKASGPRPAPTAPDGVSSYAQGMADTKQGSQHRHTPR